MSADSGLAVFATVGKDNPVYQSFGLAYDNLASPTMLAKDPALFYGFYYNT